MTTVEPDTHTLAGQIKAKAIDLGFDLVGIASAEPSRYREFFRQWLDDGHAGTMQYLSDRFDERTDPATYFPHAKTVICVAQNYHVKLDTPPPGDRGRIARYALGDDYHDLLKDRLKILADWLRAQAPGTKTRIGVDTAPVMEKELAARAGIGWMGKNTCIIHPEIGSWIMLGEVLTTLSLPTDNPAIDRCGSCTRCIDACPTDALANPYQLDASKCISYLTIEHRDAIPLDLQGKMSDWLYGCDICQDVCPWNRKSPFATTPALQPRFPSGTLDIADLQSWTTEDYRRELKNSAMKRIKLPILQRNAQIIAQNKRAHRSAP